MPTHIYPYMSIVDTVAFIKHLYKRNSASNPGTLIALFCDGQSEDDLSLPSWDRVLLLAIKL